MITKSIGSKEFGKITIPLRMVLVTSAPAKIAPLSSKTAAIIKACLMVTVLRQRLFQKNWLHHFHLY